MRLLFGVRDDRPNPLLPAAASKKSTEQVYSSYYGGAADVDGKSLFPSGEQGTLVQESLIETAMTIRSIAVSSDTRKESAVAAVLRNAGRVGRRSEAEAVTAVAEEQPAVLTIGVDSGAVDAVADQPAGVRGRKRGVGLRSPRVERAVDLRSKRAVNPVLLEALPEGTQ